MFRVYIFFLAIRYVSGMVMIMHLDGYDYSIFITRDGNDSVTKKVDGYDKMIVDAYDVHLKVKATQVES